MTLVFFVYGLATAAAPVLFGQLLQAQRDLARRLVEIEEAREHERALHAQAVLARERAQLAREMHDVVSHQVSLIAVRAGALQVAAKDADAKEAARTIRSLSVTTLDELRTMVTLLRASGGQATELTPQPTLVDLHRLVESSGTHAQLKGELPPTVGTPTQRAPYRTVQEALTNVRKHAPGATARQAVSGCRTAPVRGYWSLAARSAAGTATWACFGSAAMALSVSKAAAVGPAGSA